MSFPTDWDINEYRTAYESEEHWELRKAFMEAHKETFPENELVCLAQVFTNIEFLGCRYPAETMARVAHLSKDVAAKFRQSRSGRLKRTFVGASDAASAKAKGRGTQAQTSKSTNQNDQYGADNETSTTTKTTNMKNGNTEDNNQPIKRTKSNESTDDDDFQRPSFAMNSSQSQLENNFFTSIPKRIPSTGFIIYESMNDSQSINIIQTSAAKQGAEVKFEMKISDTMENVLEGVVKINNKVYATVPITTNKKEAKAQAFDKALEYARKIHYTIKQKATHSHSVDVDQNEDQCESGQTKNSVINPALTADNKGFKMMKMLGWTGGALGLSGNGIEQPISIEMKIDRKGLGLSADSPNSKKLNHDFFVDYLTKYKTDVNATYDLVFSKDFSKDERKSLHEIANRLSLKSRSRNGEDGSRYLIVYKKLVLESLANEILNDGPRASYYELIPPTEPIKSEIPQNSQINSQQHQSMPYTKQNHNNYQKPNTKRFKYNPNANNQQNMQKRPFRRI